MTVELASDVLHLVTMQAFFKRYDYKHEVLVQAADGPTGVVFSFIADSVSCLFLLPSLPIVPADLNTCMHTHTHMPCAGACVCMRNAFCFYKAHTSALPLVAFIMSCVCTTTESPHSAFQ